MITGAWIAARHDKTRFKRINGYGSKGRENWAIELTTIQIKRTAANHYWTHENSRVQIGELIAATDLANLGFLGIHIHRLQGCNVRVLFLNIMGYR
jgi:hypothetical protein